MDEEKSKKFDTIPKEYSASGKCGAKTRSTLFDELFA